MSTGPRITLEQAEAFVLALFQRRLGYASIEDAAAQGVEVVGSIRRRRPDIGDIEIIDADKDIGAEANLSVKQAEDVKKAVAAFRRKHRKAAREAEREGQE